jgi:hypothetical protein
MTEQQMTSKAREHWTKWLPQKTAELMASGEWMEATQAAGKLAAARVQDLTRQGFQAHEAEEVALAEFVLLKPEAEAGMLPWEKAELRQMERQHRQMMKD